MSSAARTTPGGINKRTALTTKDLQQNCTNTPAALVPSVLEIVNSPHCSQTGFVECLVTRDVTAPKPRYSLTFQSSQASSRPAIVAEKQSSVGGHYQLFDMSRAGPAEAVLSKKAGHYIGKLRQDSNGLRKKLFLPPSTVSYSLYNAKEDKERIGAFLYDAPSVVSQWYKEYQPPRKIRTIVATSTAGSTSRSTDGSCALPNDWPARTGVGVETECDDSDDSPNNTELHVLKTKEPFFDTGQYRLNFSGRVTVPSVKNFQHENAKGDIVLQFGRVSDHKFHLDFKHPFSAALAFSVALTQFDV